MANSKNFKSFVDPDGGEWIEVGKASKYSGVIWRPVNMELSEDDQITFGVEVLKHGFEDTTFMDDAAFQHMCSSVIKDILEEQINV